MEKNECNDLDVFVCERGSFVPHTEPIITREQYEL